MQAWCGKGAPQVAIVNAYARLDEQFAVVSMVVEEGEGILCVCASGDFMA